MAWQCISAHANAVESQKAVSPYYQQTLEIVINGANSDVTLDLNNASGTFWTAALADGTYGAVAAQILALLQQIEMGAAAYLRTEGNFTLYRPRVLTGSEASGTFSGNYDDTHKCPYFAFLAGNGPGGTNVIMTWEMKPGWLPIQIDLPIPTPAYTAP